jgi:hypothetical protein
VWGEVELAWRMRAKNGAAPWLTVTGTNGKTTTVNMLASILRAAGLRATSAGNVGTPILEAVLHPQPFDVIAVELSSFQLHWQRSVSPVASACLNVAPDHLDWHGSFEEYLRAKGRVYQHTHIACVYNVADPLTEQLVMEAEVVEGCRAIGFTLGVPATSMLGLVDDVPGRPRVRRDAAALGGRARDAARPPGRRAEHRARTTSRTRWPRRPRSRIRRRAVVGAGRAARLPSRPAPHRRRRDGRRHPVRQRLQGHQPPRGVGVAALVRAASSGSRAVC